MREAITRAEFAARRAIALDERSADAYTALGDILDQRGMVDQAGAAYGRAIEIDPRYPTARQWYASHLLKTGEISEGLNQMHFAEQLDPLSLVISVELAEFLDVNGKRKEATTQYLKVLERYPWNYVLNIFAALHFLVDGDFDRAGDLFGQLAIDLGADSAAAKKLTVGIRDPATRRATLMALADTTQSPDIRVNIHRALDGPEAAFAEFERMVDGPLYEAIYLGLDLAALGPDLSAHPRMKAAIQRWLTRLRGRFQ
jgi:tetratricopeptide (TPR) repeat protein